MINRIRSWLGIGSSRKTASRDDGTAAAAAVPIIVAGALLTDADRQDIDGVHDGSGAGNASDSAGGWGGSDGGGWGGSGDFGSGGGDGGGGI